LPDEGVSTQTEAQAGPWAAYPGAERLDLVEVMHGRRIADPYRWLEDAADPRTRDWCAEQDQLFARWQARWLGNGARERLRHRLAALADAGTISAPVWRGDRQFFTRRGPGQDHALLITVGPDGAERTLIDPSVLDPSGQTTLDGWFPSQEGRLLAYLSSAGGSEESVLRVMDVTTGEAADGPIDRTRYSALAWLPGGAAFYYRRLVPGGGADAGSRIYLHRVGTDPDQDVLVFGAGLARRAYPAPVVSRDGRWLEIWVEWGPLRSDIYLADLAGNSIEAPRLEPVQSGIEVFSSAWVGRDGRLYVLTTAEAPNRRLCVADPEHPDPAGWQTLLAEDPEAVLSGVAILDGAGLDGAGLDGAGLERPLLLALRTRHAVSELTLHDLATGELVGPVPTPGLGTVKELSEHPDGGPLAWFSYTDFRTPPGVYRFDARTREVTPWAAPPGAVTPRGVEARQVTYTSRDGTPVRMFILSPSGRPDRPRPAILYAYGTFGHARTPGFDPFRLAWVEAGGVYAIANVRGGGEEGEAWHRAGLREHRQNTFDDVHAAGDYLVENGWTTRAQLGLHGGSAGGQVMANVLTQRPGAYAAALCSAADADMVRAELFGSGALAVIEYGSARDPQQLGWLLAQSPYHHVQAGTPYPAVLLTVFGNDARVDPLHARKFAAALQHATSAPPADRPILLLRQENVGHTGRSVSQSIPLWLDQLGFFAWQLGLDGNDRPG
jgi:prolyl oligopeptidase